MRIKTLIFQLLYRRGGLHPPPRPLNGFVGTAARPPVLRRGSIAAVLQGNDGGRGTLPRPATGLSTLAGTSTRPPLEMGGKLLVCRAQLLRRPPCQTAAYYF